MKRSKQRKNRSLQRGVKAACLVSLLGAKVSGQAIFREDFEELTLGPNVEETLAGAHVWTRTPPTGWTQDNSKMPGFGNPARDGVQEWAGFTFANKDWWVQMAGDQRRSEFVFGHGTVMIADNDEWDDATHAKGFFDASITSKAIGITNAPANSLVMVYDSSWRPEALDDGSAEGDTGFPVDADGNRYNDQTVYITTSFDGAAPVEIQRWDSISDNPNFHDHFPNESVVIPLSNPAGAKNVTLKFGMEKSANDWWWALDNIAIGTPPFASGIAADGVSFTVKIVEALGKSVDQSKGVTLALDGTGVTPVTLSKDGDFVSATYSQAPTVFAPGSKHTVKVNYTSNEGKALEDTLQFVAPTYVSPSATPSSVLAGIHEADWMKVDESKAVKFSLDGSNVTPVTVSRADTVVNAAYQKTPPFAPNSAHTMDVTFTTASGQQLVETVTFTAPDYPTVPTALATAAGTGTQAGMRWRTHQLATSRGTTIAEAEAELAGTLGPSIHITDGQGPNGFFAIDYVNFDQAAAEAGNFKSSADAPQNVDDLAIPGIDPSGNTDNIAAETLTFVEFPQAGIYTMVVNSDDGFQVSTGTTNRPTQVVLGKFDGGRGSSDTSFYFKIDQAGVYFFRLLWFEGGGGANVEWFTVNANGTRALVGGSQTGALKAYRARTVAEPGGGGSPSTGASGAIFRENFEELTLGPNVEETLAGAHVWARTPPAGWTQDNSKMPGFGNPALDGIQEWAGFTFANKDWWVQMAGDQRRSEFAHGLGTVMIADNDEWDDATHAKGFFDASITTKPIGVTNAAPNSLVMVYDSSWRPEALDDGSAEGTTGFPVDADGNRYNDQTVYIRTSFDGAPSVEIQRWDSISDNPNFHDHFPDETVVIPLSNPANAKNLTLKFGMEKAANDWWWALDNIAVGVPPFASGIAADGVSFTVRIVEALGKSVDQSKGVTLELDGQAVTPVTLAKDGDFVTATYSQAQVFAPGSHHTVKAKFTSNDARALEDALEFIAPRYVSPSATPSSVLAAIKEADWMKVDESKGVKFTLDGANATPVTVSRADTVVNAAFAKNPPFAPNSAHALDVTFTTIGGQQLVETVSFTAPNYPTIPTTLATALGTAAQAGMRWRTHQLATSRGTTIAEAENQLAGKLGASVHDTTGQGTDGYFPIDYVNFDQAAGEAGNFKSSANAPQNVDDLAIPGIDVSGNNDNIAGEALAFVEIPQAGIYTMVVNSDDGFQLAIGTTNSPNTQVIGKFDGGRGSADTAIYFKIDQAGVYFFRLLWFEGGGGANVEWFTVNPDGSRALVGGTQTGALKAYRVRTVAEPQGSAGQGGIVSVSYTGGKLGITYDGGLFSSPVVTDPFQPVTGATSPYSVTPQTSGNLFFIAK